MSGSSQQDHSVEHKKHARLAHGWPTALPTKEHLTSSCQIGALHGGVLVELVLQRCRATVTEFTLAFYVCKLTL